MAFRTSVSSMRKEYQLGSLLEQDVAPEPITQFSHWWQDATQKNIEEMNAMSLSTIDKVSGMPDARIVLLKEYDEKGFYFFTNYESKKAQDIEGHPKACLLFFWKELERQVRIQGVIEKIDTKISEAYFKSRPLGSQLSAWASEQSKVIENREVLEKSYADYAIRFQNDVPKPKQWGGYCLKPVRVEFWQGRASRLHDRLVYQKEKNNWQIQRLAP